jgi:hypothetical protein
MTLVLRKLSTLCRAGQTFDPRSSMIDAVARGSLATELGACLGPSLDGPPPVVRLNRVRVKFSVPARGLSPSVLAEAWARALARALHQALAGPESDGAHGLARYESRGRYQAAMLHHLATQGGGPSWQFPELAAATTSKSQTALDVLVAEPRVIVETLEQLAASGSLEIVLGMWDDLALERVVRVVAEGEGSRRDISLAELIELTHLAGVPDGLFRSWPFAGRAQAIRVWLRLSKRLPLRDVWHALRLLRRLLNATVWGSATLSDIADDPVPFPAWCAEATRELVEGAVPGTVPRGSATATTDFLASLDQLRPAVPSAARSDDRGTWVASECAGIMLLVPIVRRLGLWSLTREPEFVRFGGPRALSFLLAAAAMTLVGPWDPDDAIDPAAALFAGVTGEVDRAGMKEFFAVADVRALADGVTADSWPAALQALATELARQFALQIRGFRHASREAIAKQFLRVPGRVLVEERRLLVVLDTNPWAVALHIAGADSPIDAVEWCGGRRVEFQLEGL